MEGEAQRNGIGLLLPLQPIGDQAISFLISCSSSVAATPPPSYGGPTRKSPAGEQLRNMKMKNKKDVGSSCL